MPASLRTVLLVDDDSNVVSLLSTALTLAGYHVVTASDGREALTRYDESPEPIDLSITDNQMPNLSGHDLAKRLRDMNPDLPIIFISGSADAGSRPTETFFPNHFFLAKPFAPSDLISLLTQLHGGSAEPTSFRE